MKKDLVVVKSKTINNEAVPVVLRVVEVRQGEIIDEREISRTYIFESFKATMPLKHARALLKQHKDKKEFRIIKAASDKPSKTVLSAVKTAKEKTAGILCSECNTPAKSKAGLTAHIRYNHPELFAEMYPAKAKKRVAPKPKKKAEVKPKTEKVPEKPKKSGA